MIRQELHDCTYEHVDGFWEKYFEDKEWVEKSEQICELVKENGRWDSLTRPPTEEAVWNWWSDTQEKFFQGSRGVYYTTASKKDLTGTDSERQLDLFMKHRDVSPDGKHHWEDVRVVGEHKASHTDRAIKFFQLARYIRDVFTTQPTRRCLGAQPQIPRRPIAEMFLLKRSSKLDLFQGGETFPRERGLPLSEASP